MLSNGLVLYPPGYPPNGFLTLPQVPSASGVHYRAGDIDFRSKGDLATLEMGRERYVDCVANPAAAVWQETLPRAQRLANRGAPQGHAQEDNGVGRGSRSESSWRRCS